MRPSEARMHSLTEAEVRVSSSTSKLDNAIAQHTVSKSNSQGSWIDRMSDIALSDILTLTAAEIEDRH